MSTLNLKLLDKQILKLREQLEDAIELDLSNLSSPELLEITRQIDQLIVSYIKRTPNR